LVSPTPRSICKNRTFVSGLAVLPLDDAITETFGRTRASLRRRGLLIPDLDLLIAATALAYDLTLLTRNRRHFQRIPDLKLYEAT
jgi:tRNA(fMet)-specific endonuclease VapC